jgi:peptidoglycan/xylan/chitin deacetylase (PgdA/CDA1 family)
MYHRIAHAPFDPWRLAVSRARFDEHMSVLREHFNPVPLAELADRLGRGSLGARTVVVTFDDGYRDGLYEAKPVLERHGVPATIFVASGYVGSGRDFWWHELERICMSEVRPREGAFGSHGVEANWTLPSPQLYLELWDQLHRLAHPARLEHLDRLAEVVGAPTGESSTTLSEQELRELASSELIEIAAHTVHHPTLPSLSPSQQLEEIRESRLQLEHILGRSVTGFSYPHGELTDETVHSVRTAGFKYACFSESAAVRSGADCFRIPRRRAEGWRGDEFAWHLSRFFR